MHYLFGEDMKNNRFKEIYQGVPIFAKKNHIFGISRSSALK